MLILFTVSLQNLVNQLRLIKKTFFVNLYHKSVTILFGGSLYTSQNIGMFFCSCRSRWVVFFVACI